MYGVVMDNNIVYVPFDKAFRHLIDYGKSKNFDNVETIRWIVVKVLRLRRDQFDDIYQVEDYNLDTMKNAINRYIKGESLSKIFGFIEFCGNFFDVTDNVFDPRLSTESLISAVVDSHLAKNKNVNVIDLCTGSGSVAITLSLKLGIPVDGVDISPFALETATKNNEKLNGQAKFFEMDLNQNWSQYLDKKYDIIVSNPPYWNAKKILENTSVVSSNPLIGFDGGEDGLHYIRRIIDCSTEFLKDNGELYIEMDPDQEDVIRCMLNNNYTDIKIYKDYRNINRVIGARLK